MGDDRMPTFASTGELTHHDLGCRCWPHVSERDALDAIAAVGLAEYRDGKRTVQGMGAHRGTGYHGDDRNLAASQPVPTDVPGLREALTFIADWANDCASPEDMHGGYGFADIEKLARAALAASPDAPRVAGLDVERLARALVHADVDDESFHAAPTAANVAANLGQARRIVRWMEDDGYRPTPEEWDDYAIRDARLSDIGDTATPATSDEP